MVAAFVLITSLVLMLLCSTVSVQVIHKIFSLRVAIKPALPKNLLTGVALFLWFVVLTTFVLRVSLFLFKSFYYQQLDSRFTVKNIDIDRRNCQILINTIYYEENKIYKVENHRYIEEVSPDFAVKVKYHKGAKKLKKVAKKYLDLNLAEPSNYYAKKIAKKLQAKATLFQQRIEIEEDNQVIENILELLENMDRVTEERLFLIDSIEQKCSNN
ncbi:MAG: hypothetical protein QNJ65_07140 [Xenococcaceae cyanobacterium MO_234.B1]|nr:hypothetical protein [Xenococcaceae cyanobacterium MO_234.B1]